jgi:hypothetical protein
MEVGLDGTRGNCTCGVTGKNQHLFGGSVSKPAHAIISSTAFFTLMIQVGSAFGNAELQGLNVRVFLLKIGSYL